MVTDTPAPGHQQPVCWLDGVYSVTCIHRVVYRVTTIRKVYSIEVVRSSTRQPLCHLRVRTLMAITLNAFHRWCCFVIKGLRKMKRNIAASLWHRAVKDLTRCCAWNTGRYEKWYDEMCFAQVRLQVEIRGLIKSHLPLDKMTAISQTTFPNAFSWMKKFESWLKFHWRLFLMGQLTISQHCMVQIVARCRISDCPGVMCMIVISSEYLHTELFWGKAIVYVYLTYFDTTYTRLSAATRQATSSLAPCKRCGYIGPRSESA